MIWLWLLLIVLSGFLYAVLFGAPYVPAFSKDFEELFEFAKLGKGTKFVDLGSGDGKVLLAAAKRGADVTGYEINPVLWLVSKLRLRKYRKHARVYLASMWRADLAQADVVFLFLHTKWMSKMERELQARGKRGAKVISYIFEFSDLKQVKITRNAFIYEL